MLRLILYILSGVTSALLGWNLGQGMMYFLKALEPLPYIGWLSQIRQWEEVVIFPFVTVSLAAGMVLNEIFVSNPTRPKLNLKIAVIPLLYALGIGLSIGLIIGGFLQLLPIADTMRRIIGWFSIGAIVGLVEGITWRFHSLEAGDSKRQRDRQLISLGAASLAGFLAALLFEQIRKGFQPIPPWFRILEDPFGFAVLGTFLGLVFTLTTSPSYMVALRAGKGFEFKDRARDIIDTTWQQNLPPSALISQKSVRSLSFVSEPSAEKIEEGLSIQLPEGLPVRIGGVEKKQMPNNQIVGSDIYLPSIAPHIADIVVSKRETKLIPNPKNYEKIEINGRLLDSPREIILKHNTLIAFYTDEQDQDNPNYPKLYRFVYYNRFLDPQN